MSVKAGFKTANKVLKCSQCKKPINVGERYFEAKAPLSKPATICIPCVKKAGIFTDEETKVDKTVKVTAVDLASALIDMARKRR